MPFNQRRWQAKEEHYRPYRYVDKMLYKFFQNSGSTLPTTISKVHALDRLYLTQFFRNGVPNYTESVARAIYESKFCRGLSSRIHLRPFPLDARIYRYHQELTEVIYNVAQRKEAVFASKWLHFHFPLAFPIMDKRAANALRKDTPNVRLDDDFRNEIGNVYDDGYATFCFRLKRLRQEIMDTLHLPNSHVTAKELDKYLFY